MEISSTLKDFKKDLKMERSQFILAFNFSCKKLFTDQLCDVLLSSDSELIPENAILVSELNWSKVLSARLDKKCV